VRTARWRVVKDVKMMIRVLVRFVLMSTIQILKVDNVFVPCNLISMMRGIVRSVMWLVVLLVKQEIVVIVIDVKLDLVRMGKHVSVPV
jgi:hypothetical protein